MVNHIILNINKFKRPNYFHTFTDKPHNNILIKNKQLYIMKNIYKIISWNNRLGKYSSITPFSLKVGTLFQ